jgi:mycothiol system anti-sigma-R factor
MSRYCAKAHKQLYLYLDGEITWIRRVRIRWHLRRCPGCEQGFAFEYGLREKVRESCFEEMPPDVHERLRALLRRESGSGEGGE